MPDTIPVDWSRDGDEWLTHLHTEFRETLGTSGVGAAGPHSRPAFPTMHLEYKLHTEEVDSTLVLVFEEDGLRVALAGEDEPSEAETERWLDTIHGAFGRIGTSARRYRWQAIIGRAPGSIPGNAPDILAAFEVGGLSVRRGGALREWTSGINTPPSLGSVSSWSSRLCVVEGYTDAYKWDVASRLAGRSVHRLCALLSLAILSTWIVREIAQELTDPSWNLEVPTRLWWQTEDDTEKDDPEPEGASIPSWLPGAWARLAATPYLDDAVAAYHQGLLLQHDHPSLALIAFIAAVEAVGAQLFSLDRCPECHMIRGSTQRFRETLRLVMNEQDASELAKAYQPRSRTVHAGKLHGNELLAGQFVMPGLFIEGTGIDFQWRTVLGLSRAARLLLLGELIDDRLVNDQGAAATP